MKITFTQDEVKELVLEHVWAAYPRATLNRCEVDKYSNSEYMTVSFKEPEVPATVTAGEQPNE